MNRIVRRCFAPLLLLTLAGCAGGWRNGAPPSAASAGAATAPAAAGAKAGGPVVAADGVTFTYQGEAGTVNLAGSFNSWSTSADPMQKQGADTWVLKKPLPSGKHLYKFVIDGGTWKEDPNALATADDGYGGKNAVVEVGGAAAAAGAAVVVPVQVAGPGGPVQTATGVVFTYKGAAQSVHLAGEFNAWSTSADPLTQQADGSWTITKPLAPGRYPYKFVIDEGASWKEDPNAAESVDDGYGGKNSIVVVKESGAASAAPAAVPVAAAVPVTGQPRAPFQTDAGVTFTYAAAAKSVHLAGDFNGWSTTSDPMTRQADGTWTIIKKLPAGTHGYKFVVDGSNWKQDTSNPESNDDGFGGKNSVVTVK
jgi:1,4-alpha-glucan branching enzyme